MRRFGYRSIVHAVAVAVTFSPKMASSNLSAALFINSSAVFPYCSASLPTCSRTSGSRAMFFGLMVPRSIMPVPSAWLIRCQSAVPSGRPRRLCLAVAGVAPRANDAISRR